MAQVRRTALFLTVVLTLSGEPWISGLHAQEAALPELPRPALNNFHPSVRASIEDVYSFAQSHPMDAAANGKLGMMLHAHNLFDEAEICYRRARTLDPQSFSWAYYLALVQLGRGNTEVAAETLREALSLKPDYLPAQIRLGECLRVSANFEEAGKIYEAALLRDPNNAHALYGLGRVFAARNDLARATQLFQKACEIFPDFGPAHYALAQAYQRQGKVELAEAERKLYKKNESAFPQLADPLLDEVRALYRDYTDYMMTGELFGGKGRLEEAAAAYEGALEINPQLPEAHARLIYIYGRLGQTAKAEEHFRTAISIAPNTAEAYFNYGSLVLNQGDPQRAQELFQKAVEINPRYAEAQNSLGYLFEGQGKQSEALAQFRKALESSPAFPQAHFNLGRVLVKQEDFEEGIPHLLKALATEDEEIKASYFHALGIAFATFGDLENALRYMRLARQRASAQNQTRLVESIDEDLRLLGVRTTQH
jgi:tetratricopeptide (TPR) repeat protein